MSSVKFNKLQRKHATEVEAMQGEYDDDDETLKQNLLCTISWLDTKAAFIQALDYRSVFVRVLH